jgi:sugar diacid utilization regulator
MAPDRGRADSVLHDHADSRTQQRSEPIREDPCPAGPPRALRRAPSLGRGDVRRPQRDVHADRGVGPARPLERLTESYRLATRALGAARACGLAGVHDVPALGLRAAVAADEDVGDAFCARYVEPLAGASSSAELMATVRAYLASQMHVERTAEQLFVHQNTVRYRLARFEELTGASLRDPQIAFEVWWALERTAMDL